MQLHVDGSFQDLMQCIKTENTQESMSMYKCGKYSCIGECMASRVRQVV